MKEAQWGLNCLKGQHQLMIPVERGVNRFHIHVIRGALRINHTVIFTDIFTDTAAENRIKHIHKVGIRHKKSRFKKNLQSLVFTCIIDTSQILTRTYKKICGKRDLNPHEIAFTRT